MMCLKLPKSLGLDLVELFFFRQKPNKLKKVHASTWFNLIVSISMSNRVLFLIFRFALRFNLDGEWMVLNVKKIEYLHHFKKTSNINPKYLRSG